MKAISTLGSIICCAAGIQNMQALPIIAGGVSLIVLSVKGWKAKI